VFPNNVDRWLYPNEKLREERDPIYIAESKDLSGLKIYLDCGKEDSYGFYDGCEKLYSMLKEKGVDIQYHLNEGGHTADYIRSNVEKYLLFYSGK
jgi:hypothetical protein